MEDVRPLAVVMVADPSPLTLANLTTLSQSFDLLLTEGSTTTSGEPRQPLRQGWRELLGLAPPQLRVLTTDLAGENKWQRQRIQRDSAAAVIGTQPSNRMVLLVDSDELLDGQAVLELATSPPDRPVRLGLVPLYGAVDRTARSIHCCFHRDAPDLRFAQPQREYVVAAPALARAGEIQASSPTAIRFSSPLLAGPSFGVHATMTEEIPMVRWKLANMRHLWEPRVLSETHLRTMLSAGVHHSGWWIANYRPPEPWLSNLAVQAGLRINGPMQAESHLMALRAWAQARLDPRVPDSVVESIDDYVAARRPDAQDFLPILDELLRASPVQYTGHAEGDAGVMCHGGCMGSGTECADTPGDVA